MLSRKPEKSVPMARGNVARIMNISAEGGEIAPVSTGTTSRRANPCRMPLSRASTAGCGFTSLAQARVVLGCWRADYNDARPHSQLGWRTPSEFAFTLHPRRDLALRYAEGSAPAPVAPATQTGK